MRPASATERILSRATTTLCMAWQQVMLRVFTLMLLAGAALSWLLRDPQRPQLWLDLMCWHLALLMAVAAVGEALQAQNQPTLARLLPGQPRALRRQQQVLWLLGSVAHALPYALIGSMGPATLCLAALAVTVQLTMVGARLRVWLPVLLLGLGAAIGMPEIARLMDGRLLWPALTLLTLASLVGLARLIRSGDGTHRHRYAQQRSLIVGGILTLKPERLRSQMLPVWWRRWSQYWFWRHWQRLLARPTPANALPRLAMVVQGHSHWTLVLCSTTQLSAFMLPLLALDSFLDLGGFGKWLLDEHNILLIWLLLTPLLSLLTSPGASGRREQTLLALLPGLPQRTQLALAWAKLQLRHYLRAWLIVAGLSVLLMAAGGRETMERLALALSLGLALSLRIAYGWPVRRDLGILVLPLSLLFGTALLRWLPVPAVTGLLLLLTLLGWALAWPRLARAPSPFTYNGSSV